jgi:hypothetical protein
LWKKRQVPAGFSLWFLSLLLPRELALGQEVDGKPFHGGTRQKYLRRNAMVYWRLIPAILTLLQ